MGKEFKSKGEEVISKMRLKKSFQLAINIFFHSKLRSWLTIIGIIIGIAAVVAIVSISQGAQQQLEERLSGLGADVLTITAGSSKARGTMGFGGGDPFSSTSSVSAKNLTAKDVLVLKTIDNVAYVMGQVSGKGDITYSGKTSSASITGVDASVWKDITTEEISEGRFLVQGDSYSVVLGGDVVSRTFDDAITINSKIIIEGTSFKVVGITDSGSSIYMPIDIAREILEDVGEKEFSSISVKIKDVDLSDATVEDITEKLMLARGILQEKNIDFSVSSPAEMQETMQETMDTMTLFLGAIAAISLIVGAVGIANTMFTSVLEKTRDIGIMKAIGTKNKDIMYIFLFNSGLIGLVGGIGGIILGYSASTTISTLSGITTSGGGGLTGMLSGESVISGWLIIGVLLFSILVGMIAGAIPAYRASKLNPVDALKYE
ncbi:MAG: ABC transporter permease [Flavobacterium sp.]|uniref:ABC transporter permease n=1 Tax=Flavobacterium sp. TaxID=239 RepID=UPI0026357CD9|nr:ABC transporter permease [Flavobacterium sp.]MDD5149099.1 ABC transporter permease [Flavobacterium sp.]